MAETKTNTKTAESAQADEKKPERVSPQLEPARFRPAEYERQIHVAYAMPDTIPQSDLQSLSYFAHVANKMKVWDRIEVRADDATWFAELLVLEIGRNWSRQKLLGVVDLTTKDVAQSAAMELDGYRISHRGEFAKWSVIRKLDNALLKDGFATEGQAIDWLRERFKAGV